MGGFGTFGGNRRWQEANKLSLQVECLMHRATLRNRQIRFKRTLAERSRASGVKRSVLRSRLCLVKVRLVALNLNPPLFIFLATAITVT